MRRFLLVVVVLASGLVTASPADACTCVPPDAGRLLRAADGAFVGTFLERDEPVPGPGGVLSSGQPVEYRFRVDRVLKGDIGPRIGVVAAAGGASCGLEVGPGQQVGLVLDRAGDSWHSSLCQTFTDPSELVTAAPGGGVDPDDRGGNGGVTWPLAVVAGALLASVAAIGAAHMRRPT